METTLDQRFYHGKMGKGKEMIVQAFSATIPNHKMPNTLLQFRKQWDKLSDDDIIECQIKIISPDVEHNCNTPIGVIECMKTESRKSFKTTVAKYMDMVQRFHKEGVEVWNTIPSND